MRLALFSVITAHECDLNFGSWYFWNIWLSRARSFRFRALWMICITELSMASKNASALGAQAFSQLSSRRRGRISCNDPVMNAHSESNTELHCLCTSEMRNPTQMSGAHRLCWTCTSLLSGWTCLSTSAWAGVQEITALACHVFGRCLAQIQKI